ncbi:toxin-activating lysine-acyltransferase [Roseibium polysiphoniae]|uniref:RTX toxin-activating lysine-acyltransferase n=1 Tax=Roseibium polysiphoniae TaxID=2571221 RepID=A0A944CES4_9HYPH|nr:toxin-activating lysine-acyltransferase [Roseibium polysiphoniae]MBS8260643.1 toxin-activating lysine-acyltransferase [Roseibium polysiphoniae]
MTNSEPVCIESVPVKAQTAVLGGLVWLCQHSELHRNYPVGMLLNRVAGSLELNQYRYYENENGVPIGFCNWALLSDIDLADALAGNMVFEPCHWRSGGNLFFPEFLAPFGHCRMIVRDIRQNIVPPSVRGWSLRGQVNEDGTQQAQKKHRFVNA